MIKLYQSIKIFLNQSTVIKKDYFASADVSPWRAKIMKPGEL